MGSVCWEAITMDKLALLMIVGVFIIISFGQDSLLSAATSHDGLESLVDRLDKKVSQMMKEQQEEIKQLKEENKQQQEDINDMQVDIKRHQEDIISLQKENQENKGKMKKLQRENLQQQDKITHLEADSKKCSQETLSKIEEQTNQVFSLTELMYSLSNTFSDQEKSINVLRDPPSIFYCGYRQSTTVTSSVLTFDRLSYSRSNQPIGGLDPVTGVFTSPFPATYSVSWSLTAGNDAGDNYVSIHLHKNGASVGAESLHYSSYTGASGRVSDQGGRTLILHLDMGETLAMYCDDCSAHVLYVNFCVSLVQFDHIVA